MRRSGPHGDVPRPEVSLGGLRLSGVDRRIFNDEKPLELSPREFAVLEMLLLRHGRVVSKAQLQDHLTHFGGDLGDTAIEVYVHRVRKKLENCRVEIVTVRGFGYLLQEIRQPPRKRFVDGTTSLTSGNPYLAIPSPAHPDERFERADWLHLARSATTSARVPPSLRRSLLRRLAAPLSLLALMSGLMAYWLAWQYTQHVVDRSLADLATAISKQIQLAGVDAPLTQLAARPRDVFRPRRTTDLPDQ